MHNCNLGNTKPDCITKQRSRKWCFTLNHYSDIEYDEMNDVLHKRTLKYVIGKEVGEQGTPHLQGYAYFKNPVQLTYLKKINERTHWEVAKGSPEQNLKYCTKSDESAVQNGFVKKIPLQEQIRNRLFLNYSDTKWKPWQSNILNILDQDPDTRTINWVYDEEGNSGKSYLTKYLAITQEIIIADGKKDNIFNQVNRKLNEEEKEFKIVVLDIPRSSAGYINYGVLEQLKNGLIYSGKYEGGTCLFDNVHVIVFANFMPDESQFSLDRWNIINVNDQEYAAADDCGRPAQPSPQN